MYSVFDLRDRDTIKITFVDQKIKETKEFSRPNRDLLNCFAEAIDGLGIDSSSIKGIGVFSKTGSFTSTRIATTIANGFAFSLGIKVVAIAEDIDLNFGNLNKLFLAAVDGKYVSAEYISEPNIGPTKK